MTRPTVRCRGFTLVEMLIVCGIVVLLVAILLPTVRLLRQASVAAHCASNLRQVGAMIAAYAADNNGEIPAVYGVDRQSLRPMGWSRTVVNDHGAGTGGVLLLVSRPIGMSTRDYLRNADMFICPGDSIDQDRRAAGDFATVPGAPSPSYRSMSYVYCYVPEGGDSYEGWAYFDPKQKGPPKWDGGIYAGFERHSINQKDASSTAIMEEVGVFHFKNRSDPLFHGTGGNVLYLDGHVTRVFRDWPAGAPDYSAYDFYKASFAALDQDARGQ